MALCLPPGAGSVWRPLEQLDIAHDGYDELQTGEGRTLNEGKTDAVGAGAGAEKMQMTLLLILLFIGADRTNRLVTNTAWAESLVRRCHRLT